VTPSPGLPPSPWIGRSHAELAELARELLLAGHLIDRSGMPQLIARFGREGMTEVAIDEWMSASPIYAPRMQRLLGFEGDTVEVIFKGLQLDIGAPPEFMDFRLELDDDHHGRFQLAHCGALMDVEPMGEEFVVAMCHTIEDPTFDATAVATNPRARMRPVHRPPRTPADRSPHCEWTVTIEPAAEPVPFPARAAALSTSAAAKVPMAERPAELPLDDGWADYSGALDPDLVLERFASATLAAILDEVALQGQLLSRGFLVPVAERVGDDAVDIGAHQLTGIAGLTTKRLAAVLGAGPDLEGIAAVLAVHPMFLPRSYVALRLEPGAGELLVTIDACPALDEPDGLTWPAILAAGHDEPVASAVQCLAPHARVERLGSTSWRVRIDPDTEPAPEPDDVLMTEFSTGAAFTFHRRR